MMWILGIAATVVFIISVVYQWLYKKQDEYVRRLKKVVKRRGLVANSGRELEEVVRKALPTIGQAMVKLHSDPLSREIETQYNRLNFGASSFREVQEASRGPVNV